MALHVIEKPKDEFESRLVKIDRVARVTAGGRRFSFRVLVLVGNHQGQVGMGIAKGSDVAKAIEKATRLARKKVASLPIREGTIPFSARVKFKSAKVIMRPSQSGGIVAGGVIRHICELGGVRHINIKILSRSKSAITNAKAAFKAFDDIKKLLVLHQR